MRGIRLVIGLALVVAACDAGAVERATSVCTTFCNNCMAPVELVQTACVEDCVGEFVQIIDQLSEACVACIQGNADTCANIDVACDQVCGFDTEPPPEPPVEIVDAGMPI